MCPLGTHLLWRPDQACIPSDPPFFLRLLWPLGLGRSAAPIASTPFLPLTLQRVLGKAQLPNDVLRQVSLDALALARLALCSLQQVIELLGVELLGAEAEPFTRLCASPCILRDPARWPLPPGLLVQPRPQAKDSPGTRGAGLAWR